MKTGTRVVNLETGIQGHVINDSFRCCSPEEILVVYDKTTFGSGTDNKILSILPEVIQTPDPQKCGSGRGADCCIFLTMGLGGFSCERFTGLRDTLIFKTMNAKRDPGEPYPECMKY